MPIYIRIRFRYWTPLVLIALSGLLSVRGYAKVNAVASITDLASIVSSVGGDEVNVSVIAKPTADVHRIEALPSYMVRVARAQVYFKVGLGLDQWADAIIDGSRNSKVTLVDCSQDVPVLEKLTSVDASLAKLGDVHPFGNPHYWLDPRNGAIVARTVAAALGKIDPPHAADYTKRAEAFGAEAERMAATCSEAGKSMSDRDIIVYHASWVYFVNVCGLNQLATVEPVPGIPPTASHLKELVEMIKEHHVQVVLYEPYFSDDAGQFLSRETGIRIAKVAPSCDGVEAGSYLAHFRTLLESMKPGAAGSRS